MGPLAANGGLTLTHGLAANSPARNAGNPAVPGTGGSACLATDQRGVARPVDGVCDIGAFEGSVPVVSSTWYVSVSGDDSHSCTTPTEPCLTINGAIARAVSGETIKVGIGTYTGPGTEVVLINKNLIFLGGWDAGFTSQTGVSTVDGQQTRQAIKIDVGRRVVMDRFEIQNGYHVISGGIENTGVLTLTNSTVSHNNSFSWGAGIHNQGNLTLNHTVVSDNTSEWQAGGIYSGEGMMLIINNSTIRDNVGGEAGGVESNGTLAMNNITLSGNQAGGNWAGSAMNVSGTVVINNSTLSGNLGVPAIFFRGGSMAINNSTIAGNPAGGTKTYSNAVELRNSIVALNTAGGGSDCTGLLLSFGYNLIGNTTGCGFTAAAGDLVGTSTDPIDPRLGLLTDNGGSTLTHALSGISPALNAGNPAPPGSGGDTCEATDQRGVARPVEARCDIGAYEGSVTLVTSFTRVNPSPTSALFVKFTVKFSEPVTGVDMVAPFSDFGLTTAGLTGAAITSVSGSGDTYQVTVNVGSGVGTIRLDVLDDDTILDLSSHPLGGVGAGNGDLPGPTYTIIYPRVTSFLRSNPNPTSASTVKFNIRFSGPVTGVDKVAPFSDFTLTTTGLTGAAITGVSGTGSNYVVTVKTGQGNGTLQLKLVDDDTIRSASDNPLGGPGAGNGGFVGPTYTVRKIPTLLSPVSITTWDRTPAFKWSNNIPAVTQYQLQIWRGTTLLYSKNVFPGSCTATACTFTPGTPLPAAAYKWRVRAAASGIWLPFSAYRALTVFAPKAGYWRGDWNDFYVTPDLASVTNFAIYVSVSGCGNYKITHTAPVPIVNGRFSFSGSFYASGSFSTTGTSATGKLGLYYFYIPGCGYLKGGPVDWSAVWNSSAQADLGAAIELLPLPGPEGTFPGPFIIESVQP